jgi:RNA polymerase-binding transcription factor DksA
MSISQPADYSAFSLRLEALRRAALTRMIDLDDALLDSSGGAGSEDAIERADRESRERSDMAQTDLERVTLREVEDAEDRIAIGCYGLCIGCGLDIPRQRMLAHPTALRCVSCQSQLELLARRAQV